MDGIHDVSVGGSWGEPCGVHPEDLDVLGVLHLVVHHHHACAGLTRLILIVCELDWGALFRGEDASSFELDGYSCTKESAGQCVACVLHALKCPGVELDIVHIC